MSSDVLVHARYRGRGYGGVGLELLCDGAPDHTCLPVRGVCFPGRVMGAGTWDGAGPERASSPAIAALRTELAIVCKRIDARRARGARSGLLKHVLLARGITI